MDHLQNVLSYFDQQQPLCAEHDRIPKDLYREFGVKAGLRDETGKGVLAGLTNISDIRAFQYVDGVKHPADGQLLYRGYDVKALINGSRGSRFAFEEAGYLLLFGQLPTPEQQAEFTDILSSCRTLPTNFTRDVIMKAPSRDMMNSLSRSVLTLASYDDNVSDVSLANVLRQCLMLIAVFPLLAVYGYHSYNHYERDESLYIHRPDDSLSAALGHLANLAKIGYYPTDPAHVAYLSQALVFPENSKINLLDPCCGEGLALERIAQGQNCHTFGVELDDSRARQACEHLERVAMGSYFYSRISHNAFQLLYLNPPYLSTIGANGTRTREERRFLIETIPHLAEHGVLIYIIPYYRLTPDIARVLCDNFEKLSVYRFCGKEFTKFHQIAVLGCRIPRQDGSRLFEPCGNIGANPYT